MSSPASERKAARAAAARTAQLRDQLAHHARAYYVHDAPEIPDADYDALFQELQALEAAHPELVTADSPTQRVIGAVLEGLQPVRHAVPMLSIDTETDTSAAEIGAATAIELGPRNRMTAVAEPSRRGKGSAKVVDAR